MTVSFKNCKIFRHVSKRENNSFMEIYEINQYVNNNNSNPNNITHLIGSKNQSHCDQMKEKMVGTWDRIESPHPAFCPTSVLFQQVMEIMKKMKKVTQLAIMKNRRKSTEILKLCGLIHTNTSLTKMTHMKWITLMRS